MNKDSNMNIPTFKNSKEKTSNTDAEVFMSGNRNNCGTDEVNQNIKKKVKKQKKHLKKCINSHNDIRRRTENKKSMRSVISLHSRF